MMDANIAVGVSPALRAFVRRVIPDRVGARPVAGVVLAVAGIVTATTVVDTSHIVLAADASSGPAPDELTNGAMPCAPDTTTTTVPPADMATSTTTEPPADTTTTTTTEPPTESTTTTIESTTTTIEPPADMATTTIATSTTTESTATSSTGLPDETAVVGVESCVDTSSDPPEPALPPSPDPTAPPTTPPNEPVQSPEPTPTAVTAAPTAPMAPPATAASAVEAPPVVTNSDAVSVSPDMRIIEAATPAVIAPSVIAPSVIEEPATSPSVALPTPPSIAPSWSPVIPEVSRTWATGATREGAPREPGPSVLRLGRTPAGARVVLADVVEVVLATIRELESGGRYDVGPNKAQASGAYQYIPSTWRHEGGFAHAYLAPREVQDARARADVERFLELYGGDVSMVPVMWYYPRAASDSRWMDRVPNPAGGNRLTIREYQERWMERFVRNAQDLLGTYVPAADSPAAVSVLSAFPEPPDHPDDASPRIGLTGGAARSADAATVVGDGVEVEVEDEDEDEDGVDQVPYELDAVTVSERTVELAARSVPPEATVQDRTGWMRSIVFPVLGPVAYANGWGDPRDGGTRRHEGTDIIGVGMQPLLAATDGRITQFRLEPQGRSGVAISIRDVDGWRYSYFHANNDTPASDDGAADDGFRLAPGLELGDEVTAGQIIGYMGDSGNAENSVAHLHFEIRDPWGRAVPSFWSLRAAEARQACTIGIGPWSTPTLRPQPDAVTDTDLVAQLGGNTADRIDSPADERERAVWHTIVTPLYGEGQWVIDSDGRVIATGDAALIMPSRTLECAPGPAIPFGTDAAGWADYGHDSLTGTVLDDVELTGTVLDTGQLTGPQLLDMIRELSLGDPHEPLLEPVVFTDPATGEKIIVTFEPPPDDTTPAPANSARPVGSSAALGPSGRREPRRAEDLDITTPRLTALRF